jgi:hypothetical protein
MPPPFFLWGKGSAVVNVRFVIRGLAMALPLAVLASAAWIFFQTPLGQPLDPTPPPPTILAPHGETPTGPVGLQEWVQYQGAAYRLSGSGFFLLLGDGDLVGITTAHSLLLSDPDHPPERIAFAIPGNQEFVAEFNTLRGLPGRTFTAEDLTRDYVLLQASQPVAVNLGLVPDARGAPQPGERLWLFSGLGSQDSSRRALSGTVQTVSETAVWVLMDEWFDPGLMSGSPFVSQHTGQVVGMAVAASPRRNRLLIGMHPIGSLVHLAESATDLPPIIEWSR